MLISFIHSLYLQSISNLYFSNILHLQLGIKQHPSRSPIAVVCAARKGPHSTQIVFGAIDYICPAIVIHLTFGLCGMKNFYNIFAK